MCVSVVIIILPFTLFTVILFAFADVFDDFGVSSFCRCCFHRHIIDISDGTGVALVIYSQFLSSFMLSSML